MAEPLILITDCDLPGDAAERTLRAAGLRAERAPETSSATLADLGAEAEGLIVQWHRIDGDLMDRMPRLRMISRLGIGYDMVDVAAATARGIAVANTPSYCIEEVAAHTVAMIVAQGRALPAYDRAVREGVWKAVDARPMAVRPSRTTVSVLGFGRIGSLVARGVRGLGFRVLVADPYASPDVVRAAGCEPVSIEEAIAAADILTLHVPLTADTHHLLDAAALATMRRGAVVVNTCRGPLIDEAALAEALGSGRLGAAALDVFEAEPLPAGSPLREAPNVLLTPHAAWYSPEALEDLPVHAAENLIRYLGGEPGAAIVNPAYADAR
ncbi:phosphoglycerate dehydrogenase-like enzyme [Microbacterium resistens]|uniref:Phosphoglycerate dehydrogenase-like enzyme n=1 Tax=Microbacterium resistens TaxID=156977 RepID=A0ABU1SBU9_9MICO|nr:C-terminal binding protein [Microbacterium resistens]MDR6867099.1 phosphoglycerate dehydrogenase-like enzyme [Microbacterium resistens]